MSLAAKRAERSGGDAHALLDDRVAVEVGDHRIAPVSLAQLLAVELVNDQVVLAWRRPLLRDLPPESALWRQLRGRVVRADGSIVFKFRLRGLEGHPVSIRSAERVPTRKLSDRSHPTVLIGGLKRFAIHGDLHLTRGVRRHGHLDRAFPLHDDAVARPPGRHNIVRGRGQNEGQRACAKGLR